MTLFNLGSINLDHFYEVPHLPQPGETILATAHSTGLGGKGANMSVAAAQAGARVVHIGAVGADGDWAVERMAALGVETGHIRTVEAPTAHAIINLDPNGENAIVVFSGANMNQAQAAIAEALEGAGRGDMLLLQNETNAAAEAAKMAKHKGMDVLYAAAPFDAGAVRAVLPFADILVLNAVEMRQLGEAVGQVDVETVVITEGAEGGRVVTAEGERRFKAVPVEAVDTTGAGDTFTGYLAAVLAEGAGLDAALRMAAGASALKVTRKGTADAIPARREVETFLSA